MFAVLASLALHFPPKRQACEWYYLALSQNAIKHLSGLFPFCGVLCPL